MMQMILYKDFEQVSLEDILTTCKDSHCGQRVLCDIQFNDVCEDERQNYTQTQMKRKVVSDQRKKDSPQLKGKGADDELGFVIKEWFLY